MSKDSSATYIHMHSPRLADHFVDFCRPPSSFFFPPNQTPASNNNTTTTTNTTSNPTNPNPQNPTNNNTSDNTAQLPGYFLPFEEIDLPPHLMPVNPEDEDDVVPDMHAAFGINRALGQGQEGANGGQAREPAWRDFGLEELVRRGPSGAGGGGSGDGVGGAAARLRRNRRDGKRSGFMMMR